MSKSWEEHIGVLDGDWHGIPLPRSSVGGKSKAQRDNTFWLTGEFERGRALPPVKVTKHARRRMAERGLTLNDSRARPITAAGTKGGVVVTVAPCRGRLSVGQRFKAEVVGEASNGGGGGGDGGGDDGAGRRRWRVRGEGLPDPAARWRATLTARAEVCVGDAVHVEVASTHREGAELRLVGEEKCAAVGQVFVGTVTRDLAWDEAGGFRGMLVSNPAAGFTALLSVYVGHHRRYARGDEVRVQVTRVTRQAGQLRVTCKLWTPGGQQRK